MIKNLRLEKKDDVYEKIINFFQDKTDLVDDDIHGLADSLKIEPDELETIIYKFIGAILIGGRSVDKKITEKDVDAKELKMGLKVEEEHIDPKNPFAKYIVKKISLDHLAEFPDYYTRLLKMEKEAG